MAKSSCRIYKQGVHPSNELIRTHLSDSVAYESFIHLVSHLPVSQSAPVFPSWHWLQSSPLNPAGHEHRPSMQRPLPLQFFGQPAGAQSGPREPGAVQTHSPFTQRPLLLQFPGQVFSKQSGPVNPGSHRHCPDTQRPLLLQFPGQEEEEADDEEESWEEQSSPVKPASHSQRPSRHLPWSLQSRGQVFSEQSRPPNPASHWQSPSLQWPLPLQFSGHSGTMTLQSGPLNPGKQEQTPSTQRPWSLQSPGHWAAGGVWVEHPIPGGGGGKGQGREEPEMREARAGPQNVGTGQLEIQEEVQEEMEVSREEGQSVTEQLQPNQLFLSQRFSGSDVLLLA